MDLNIGATRCQILRLKCTKFDFRWGSARGREGKGRGVGGLGSGGRVEEPMTSTKPRALKVASAPLGTWAVATCNTREFGPQFTRLPVSTSTSLQIRILPMAYEGSSVRLIPTAIHLCVGRDL